MNFHFKYVRWRLEDTKNIEILTAPKDNKISEDFKTLLQNVLLNI